MVRQLIVMLSLICAAGCGKYYLAVYPVKVDVSYLASTHVHTPDPRQAHPPQGEQLIVDWRIPDVVFSEQPRLILDLIMRDYTGRTLTFPVKRRMGHVTYELLDEEFRAVRGILTYRAKLVMGNGEVYKEWRHQLWVPLVSIDESEPAARAPPSSPSPDRDL